MKTRIHYLLRQYFHNRSTRPELDELFELIRSAKYDEQLSILIKELYEEIKRKDPSLTFVDRHGKLMDLSVSAEQLPDVKTKKPLRHMKLYASIGACAAMLVVGFFYGQRWSRAQIPQPQVHITNSVAKNENKVVLLEDGSKVWINSSSKLTYPQQFKKGQPREVTLLGEAYFEIERAEDWPFIVHTGDVQTKVLGTKFNVKAYPDRKDVLVTVRSGKVMVSKLHKPLATLVKNQELRIPVTESVSTASPKGKELSHKIAGAWIEGHLEYEDESISSIVADLERLYGLPIRIEHPHLGEEIVTLSTQKSDDPTHVLEVLTALTGSRFKKERNSYIIF